MHTDKKIYLSFESFLDSLDNDNWITFYIKWELSLVKELGYETGQTLGKKLELLKEQWIKNNFVLDKKIIEKSLNKIGKN